MLNSPVILTRSLLLLALLVAEVLWLELRFDSGVLVGNPTWWGNLASCSPQFLRFVIASAATFCLLGGSQFQRDLAKYVSGIRGYSTWMWWLAANLVCYAAFAGLCYWVFAPQATATAWASLVAVGWLLAGVSSVVSWGFAVFPPRTWYEFNWNARWALLASAAAGLVALFAGDLANLAWPTLASGTFSIVSAMLQCVYRDVVSVPDAFQVGTDRFSVIIAPQCSGFEGLGLIVVFLGVYLWAFRSRLRFPQALLLFPLGMSAIWLLNSIRIATLIIIGTSWSPEVAQGGFHSQAGWLAFSLVALGIVTISVRLRLFSAMGDPTTAGDVHVTNPAAAYLGPFLAAVAAGMLTGALTGGFDWLYPLRAAAAIIVLWAMRSAYVRLGWSLSWFPLAIGAGVFLLWIALLPAGSQAGIPQDLVRASSWGAIAWVICRFVGYAIVTPVIEELAFRGYLLRRLVSADFLEVPLAKFSWPAALVSSAAFGALHGANWLAGTAAGLLFALAATRRGRIGDAIGAHSTCNLLLGTYALATGNWQAWS